MNQNTANSTEISDSASGNNSTTSDTMYYSPKSINLEKLTKDQIRTEKQIEEDIQKMERISSKWVRTKLDAIYAIKRAEIEAKQYELERLADEFEADLANKEAEYDDLMRMLQRECAELQQHVHSLESELSGVKEERKRELLDARTEIVDSIRELENAERKHNQEIERLEGVLKHVKKTYKQNLTTQVQVDAEEEKVLDLHIERLTTDVHFYQTQLNKMNFEHNVQYDEVEASVQMLTTEIEQSKTRYSMISNQLFEAEAKFEELKKELLKAEEESTIVRQQIGEIMDQKARIKSTMGRIDNSLWMQQKSEKFLS